MSHRSKQHATIAKHVWVGIVQCAPVMLYRDEYELAVGP